ncbi:hypothetical protein [Mesorhizobium sp. M1143]|uniref:hypothetical protein n=1 Tax=Mesorhizobium sp. M1143 TaxID=2957061 RepID=UPI00333813C0
MIDTDNYGMDGKTRPRPRVDIIVVKFVNPVVAQPLKFLRWFLGYPGYLWPWNAGYFAASLIVWLYLTPSLETMREFHAQWISLTLARNAAFGQTKIGERCSFLFGVQFAPYG